MAHFGIAWTAFALALAVHVADEAAHDFLSVYNPVVRAVRRQLPFLPLPTFSFLVWISGLLLGIALLLALSPWVWRGDYWLRLVAWPLAIIVGIANALLHIGASAWCRRSMPGTLSAPLLLIAGIYLLSSASP
jgi:hypothetical protein